MVKGADVTLGEANGGVVTNGLVYWLDAAVPETVLTNADGRVTNWVSRAGTIAGFTNPGLLQIPKGIQMLAYDRVLSAEEVRTMEAYLMNKWMRGEGPTIVRGTVFGDGGLTVTEGGTVDFGGASATMATLGGSSGTLRNVGALTVTDVFVFPAVAGLLQPILVDGDLTIGADAVARFPNGDTLDATVKAHPALEVTGAVTGALTRTDGLPTPWRLGRSGKKWVVSRPGMAVIFRRCAGAGPLPRP